MTGLEKILDHIKQESDKEVSKVINKAQAQVDAMLDEAKAECKKLEASLAAKSSDNVKLTLERGDSAAALAKRKMLLDAKQALITEVLETAHQSLINLPDSEYFETMLKMVKKYALGQPGVIVFSKKDLDRLPADFEKRLGTTELTVSDKTAGIDGGFVIEYGDIEENCSFEALFSAQKEVLQDKIRDLLFE